MIESGVLALWLLLAQTDLGRSVIAEIYLSKEACYSVIGWVVTQTPDIKADELKCVEYTAKPVPVDTPTP